ncbi:MAG: cupin [Alphaproteobacteria bacterium]|nr:cupin [Alphaproteobacteria bacterium]
MAATGAAAQIAPPSQSRDVAISAPAAIDLDPEIGVAGRQLRIRKLVVAPGGVIGLHTHKDRPDATYLVQGTLTEHLADTAPRTREADTLSVAGKDVTHWLENRGSVPAVLIVADIPRAP